jgi:hypothetical protein
MSDNGPLFTVEELLNEQGWVRALARSLVGDEHLAEDLVQEAWSVALDSRQGDVRKRWLWLKGLVRNLARMALRTEVRRRARETAVSRSEAVPSNQDLVDRADLLRRVVGMVLDLPEPGRTTILLRYFAGLEPAGVAAIEVSAELWPDAPAENWSTPALELRDEDEVVRWTWDVHQDRVMYCVLPLGTWTATLNGEGPHPLKRRFALVEGTVVPVGGAWAAPSP